MWWQSKQYYRVNFYLKYKCQIRSPSLCLRRYVRIGKKLCVLLISSVKLYFFYYLAVSNRELLNFFECSLNCYFFLILSCFCKIVIYPWDILHFEVNFIKPLNDILRLSKKNILVKHNTWVLKWIRTRQKSLQIYRTI